MSFVPAKVVFTKRLSESFYTTVFELLEPLPREPCPPQFVNVWIPRVDEIPLSIAWFEKGRIEVFYRVVGEGTSALSQLPIGAVVGIRGPIGRCLDLEALGDRVLGIAGGTGIAPLMFLAKIVRSRGKEFDVVWGVRRGSELGEALELVKKRFNNVIVATEDGSYGYKGTVLEPLKLIDLYRYSAIVIAGPKAMERAVCVELKRRGVDGIAILEAMVKCGMGICGSCTLKPLPLLLCVDGPAFRCSEVLPHLESAGS